MHLLEAPEYMGPSPRQVRRLARYDNPNYVAKLLETTLPLQNFAKLPRSHATPLHSVLLMYSTPRASRSIWTGSYAGRPKMCGPGSVPPLYKLVMRRT